MYCTYITFHKNNKEIKHHTSANGINRERQSESAVLPEREDHAHGSVVNITVSGTFFRGWNVHAVDDGVNGNGRSLIANGQVTGDTT